MWDKETKTFSDPVNKKLRKWFWISLITNLLRNTTLLDVLDFWKMVVRLIYCVILSDLCTETKLRQKQIKLSILNSARSYLL